MFTAAVMLMMMLLLSLMLSLNAVAVAVAHDDVACIVCLLCYSTVTCCLEDVGIQL